MKRVALTLFAATAISSAQAEMGTGMYLGINASANAFAADGSIRDENDALTHSADFGKHHAGVGGYLGYGISCGCLYYAGEIGYQFINADFSFTQHETDPAIITKFKNRHSFDFAFRAGYKLTPATIAYIRLGGSWGKYKLRSSIPQFNSSKSHVTFAPGLGIETALTRNWVGRMEWSYDFGRKFSRTATDIGSVKLSSVHTQSVRFGVAYKF